MTLGTGLFNCDTIWCCWLELFKLAGNCLWALRWPAFIYAVVYGLGALVFLLTLKLKSEDGQLTVSRRSWAYMIAHPLRYGGQRSSPEMGSICVFYARMFNMLLFVWPFLLLWFLIILIPGNIVGVLLGGAFMIPDLSERAFVEIRNFWDTPTGVITVPLLAIGLLVWNFRAFLHGLGVIGWAALCLSPMIALLIGGFLLRSFYKRNSYQYEMGGESSALYETVMAHKERFCKTIRFK